MPVMGPTGLQNDIRGLALGPPWEIISTGGEPQFPLEGIYKQP